MKERKMKMKFVLMFVVAAMCSSSVFGATTIWDGATDNTWSGDNWTKYTDPVTRAAPIAGDYVVINGDVVLDVAGFGSDMQVGPNAGGSLDIQNDLTITGSAWAGMYAGGDGTINLNGPHDVSVGHFSIGFASGANGVVNMSDGTWTSIQYIIGSHEDAVGTLNMTGGEIFCDYLGFGNGVDAVANVNISGGTINQTLLANFYVDPTATVTFSGTGKIVYAGAGYEAYLSSFIGTNFINAQANVVGDTVEITAVPEPATMLLLGLGGILLRRKR